MEENMLFGIYGNYLGCFIMDIIWINEFYLFIVFGVGV